MMGLKEVKYSGFEIFFDGEIIYIRDTRFPSCFLVMKAADFKAIAMWVQHLYEEAQQ